jgi:hypothetical protein
VPLVTVTCTVSTIHVLQIVDKILDLRGHLVTQLFFGGWAGGHGGGGGGKGCRG